MEDHDSVLESLGLTAENTPVPEHIWNHALEVALDPQTPEIDDSLVPEMDDAPVVAEDELILDLDDSDDGSVDLGDDTPAGDWGDDLAPHIDPSLPDDVPADTEDQLPVLEMPNHDLGHESF
ncbi:hypothetical protein [Rhodococcus sp. NPDC049939]|uniref:hypothetical protein n=1 Tax=Rhodococcus sp. NPDC049939 TaxID=3155511 RepID=UPI0033DA5888